jgi:hypothetical protein
MDDNATMTVDEARQSGNLFLEVVSGSRAYGLATETSDTDLKGVFVQPLETWMGFERLEQVNNASNDECYYELGRFASLAARNNPTVLEMLATPTDSVRYRHTLMDHFPLELFLSKLSYDAFTGFATSQIKRAQGLNKKIMQPMPEQRKTPLDFCFVLADQGAVAVTTWLSQRGWQATECGLVAVPHAPEIYGVYHDATGTLGYRGLFSGPEDAQINLSSVPKAAQPVAWLSYHFSGYQTHCRQHQEYWQWVQERNPERYESTRQHGQGYDAKNLMHTFRLLDIAREIALTGTFSVRTSRREELLKIKGGAYTYEALAAQANERLAELKELFAESQLPEQPDLREIEQRVIRARMAFYGLI